MKLFKMPFVFAAVYGAALIVFTACLMLDTFVIPHVYGEAQTANSANAENEQSADSENNTGPNGTAEEDNTAETSASVDTTEQNVQQTEPEITANAYNDNNIQISINTYREYNTDIYVADIKLNDPLLLKSAFAGGMYGRNITDKTSAIAENSGAIVAVNGDYYGARAKGFVLRENMLFRSQMFSSDREDLAIFGDGSFLLFNEGDYSAIDMQNDGARNIFSFGPGLVSDGEIVVKDGTEVDKATSSNPRTAIGQISGDDGELHYVMLVADGRTDKSNGLSLFQLASFMKELGVRVGYNLDGGGSSTLYFNGRIVNNPTTNGKTVEERSVSDIVYIGY